VIVATVGAASLSLIVPVAEAVPEAIVKVIGFCNHQQLLIPFPVAAGYCLRSVV
jgi:hypothetical protein